MQKKSRHPLHAHQELIAEAENLGDRKDRGISWGIDAPGRGLYVRYGLHW